jgi:hypothetical protein
MPKGLISYRQLYGGTGVASVPGATASVVLSAELDVADERATLETLTGFEVAERVERRLGGAGRHGKRVVATANQRHGADSATGHSSLGHDGVVLDPRIAANAGAAEHCSVGSHVDCGSGRRAASAIFGTLKA